MNLKELYWVAGFLEGEGCFFGRLSSRSISVSASQLQRSPLERIQRLLGGNIHNTTRTAKGKVIENWYICGTHAASVMMMLYSLMSPRRQEAIKVALQRWKLQRPSSRGQKTCIYNHPPEYRYRSLAGRLICSMCQNKRYLRWKSNTLERGTEMYKGSDTPHGNI